MSLSGCQVECCFIYVHISKKGTDEPHRWTIDRNDINIKSQGHWDGLDLIWMHLCLPLPVAKTQVSIWGIYHGKKIQV